MMQVSQPYDPRVRGYSIVYRPGSTNHCPGCGRSHWYVGRHSAECAFCAVALPFAEAAPTFAGIGRQIAAA
jgi:hypothetical protein